MPHSKKCINANFGAYIQKTINEELIIEHIAKKEKKLSKYIENTNLPQWLILIIGGVGESCFEVDNHFNVDIKTHFDKIYLYEDADNKLYEIK